jgi:hypothetical protein
MYPEPLHPAASNLTPRPTASTVTSPHAPVLQNIQRVSLIVRNPFRTTPSGNSFGLWKEYLYRPFHDLVVLISPRGSMAPSCPCYKNRMGRGRPGSRSLPRCEAVPLRSTSVYPSSYSTDERTSDGCPNRVFIVTLIHVCCRMEDFDPVR